MRCRAASRSEEGVLALVAIGGVIVLAAFNSMRVVMVHAGSRAGLQAAVVRRVVPSLLIALMAAGVAWADDPEVVIEGIEIAPDEPGPETLCQLVATVRNGGSRAVYGFAFDVELNGRKLPVYEKQLFLQVIEAGASEEVALFNFWTSETGRPAPVNGKLEVLVRLREARWVEVSEIEEDGETVEVWTPVGDVSGLPQAVSLTVELK